MNIQYDIKSIFYSELGHLNNTLIAFLMLVGSFSFAQDTLHKANPPLSLAYKEKFVVTWPLSGFTFAKRNVIYKKNVVSDPLLDKIISMEPDPAKRKALFCSNQRSLDYKRSGGVCLFLGSASLAVCYYFFLVNIFVPTDAGMVTMWSTLAAGVCFDTASFILIHKRRVEKKRLVNILNQNSF